MASVVRTVHMRIGGLATLVTFGDYLVSDLLPKSLVKHKIFPMKFIFKIFLLHTVHIIDDAAFEMKHIFKALVKHVRRSFFATNATCAVHDNIFLSFIVQDFNSHGQLLTKSIAWDFNRIFKMTHLILIMITHIDHQGFGIAGELVKLFSIHISSLGGHVK